MDFFRTKSKMHLSCWDDKKLIMLEITPAMEGVSGQPAAGDIRYNKDAKCIISFSVEEAFKFAFCLNKLANGVELTYKKEADTTKLAGAEGGEYKQLTAIKSTKGGAMITLKSGERSCMIILAPEEAYAVQMYLETKAAGYL
jgi:hypothetical protein